MVYFSECSTEEFSLSGCGPVRGATVGGCASETRYSWAGTNDTRLYCNELSGGFN